MFGFPSSVVRFAFVLCVVSFGASVTYGQVTIFNSNGFDTGYVTGNLSGQQGFSTLPNNTAFSVQNGTSLSPSQAVQISGPNITSNQSFGHGNFAYQTYGLGTFNPVGSGNPFVVASFSIQTPQTLPLATDIPFAGLHFEGYSNIGFQQAVSPIMVGLNGEITVFTNSATGGSNMAVFTDVGVVPRGTDWTKITAEFNFNTQTFRVFLNNSATPIQFTRNGSGTAITPITSIPFRNTFGTTTSIAETGILAFGTTDPFGTPGSFQQPLNNVFIDDVQMVMQTTPVPEPGTILAVAAIGAFGIRTWRRRRAA